MQGAGSSVNGLPRWMSQGSPLHSTFNLSLSFEFFTIKSFEEENFFMENRSPHKGLGTLTVKKPLFSSTKRVSLKPWVSSISEKSAQTGATQEIQHL